MNGYKTRIFEMHTTPGGVCTSWTRKGYMIDGCLHWLTGTRPENDFYPIWEELGGVQDRTMIYHEEYARIEGEEGKVFIVYSDIDRLEQHMIELAPEDKDTIEDFTKGIRKCIDFPMPVKKAPELFGPVDGIKIMSKMLPYMGVVRKWSKVTLQDFARRLKNPFLRHVFPFAPNLQNSPDFPILVFMMILAWMHQKVAAYPIGGSLELARAIERRYISLGGEIHYRSRVEKILVEDNQAVGVRLTDGNEYRSDIVISAADGHTTIFGMLDGKYVNDKIKRYYDELPLFPPLVYIGLGVAQNFEEFPQTVTGVDYHLDEPITVGGKERRRMSIQVYNFDPSMAPTGKTVVRVWFSSDYEYWKKLRQDPERYRVEKELIANQVVASLDRRFPGLVAHVEMRDVATPITWERYTGNWKGSFEGWLETTDTLRMRVARERMSKTLPGLKDFYMAGQWVEPGGSTPTSVMSGRNVTQIICKQDNKSFVTSTP
jgi:phytoene dehydrogenase-like protein